TNVACPANLSLFGGTIDHVRLFEPYPAGARPQSIQRCFPAGHASGGFALLAMAALFRSSRSRLCAAAGALALGGAMAGYKMAIGDHFLSHTLVTLEIAIILTGLIHASVFRFVPPRIDRA
ncbi:MAG: phosphatase PAP2 family protein, partial [Alphaproteobacteria bacterium]